MLSLPEAFGQGRLNGMDFSFKLSVLRHLRAMKAEQWLGPEKMAGIQAKRLAGIVGAARSLGRTLPPVAHPDELQNLPIISKEDVLRSPALFLDESLRGPLVRATSSGTTGKPLRVLMDLAMAADTDAAKFCFLTDFGLSPLDRYAETTITRNRPASDFLGPFRRLMLPVLGDEGEHLALLKKHRINALRAYPSIAEVMAALNRESAVPLKLKLINCGAEMLTKEMRRNIESSFSSEIFVNYGVTEFGYVAWECPEEHGLHVNCSSTILEIVDGNGKSARSGEIVLTTLHNRAMPLIRYRTGDTGRWGRECACGRLWPVLESLDGRLAEAVELPSGRLCPSIKFYFPSGMKSDVSSIRQYQVVQEEPGLFVFRFVPSGKGPGPECLAEVREKLLQAAGEPISVEFERAERISREPSGKFRHVIPYRPGPTMERKSPQ